MIAYENPRFESAPKDEGYTLWMGGLYLVAADDTTRFKAKEPTIAFNLSYELPALVKSVTVEAHEIKNNTDVNTEAVQFEYTLLSESADTDFVRLATSGLSIQTLEESGFNPISNIIYVGGGLTSVDQFTMDSEDHQQVSIFDRRYHDERMPTIYGEILDNKGLAVGS